MSQRNFSQKFIKIACNLGYFYGISQVCFKLTFALWRHLSPMVKKIKSVLLCLHHKLIVILLTDNMRCKSVEMQFFNASF